jgi:hypothetical protein
MQIRLEFKPQDLWVGLYWTRRRYHDTDTGAAGWMTDLWVCVVPMVPLHIRWWREC